MKHHRYPEEVRLDTINRAVAALKRRLLYEYPRINTWEEGQNAIDPDSGRAVEKASAPAGRGQNR